RLRDPARRRARARARLGRDHDEPGRRGGATRQLARLDQSAPGKPDGLRDDGRKVRGMSMSEPKPVRRIVTIDDQRGASHAAGDGPSPDVRTDPARPGWASTRIWVTTASPPAVPKQYRDALLLPHMVVPPPQGSLCRIVEIPPDAAWRGKVGGGEVA